MTEEIWVRNYINPKIPLHRDPLYFTIIDKSEVIIKQNNSWKNNDGIYLIASLELNGFAQDRKLRSWEIVKLKLLDII